MERRPHFIDVSTKVRRELASSFGVNAKTVQNALTYVRNNALALRIRRLALQKGGVEKKIIIVRRGSSPGCDVSE